MARMIKTSDKRTIFMVISLVGGLILVGLGSVNYFSFLGRVTGASTWLNFISVPLIVGIILLWEAWCFYNKEI